MNPQIDAFLDRAPQWKDEMRMLRAIALDAGLSEALKWGKPCYAVPQGNVAIIQPFKESCALLFFKGALLADPEGLLEAPGPNSRAGRRVSFASVDDVARLEAPLRALIARAVEVEEAGRKVEGEPEPLPLPEELAEAFAHTPGLQEAFERLTPGRRRAYLMHIAEAKRSATRASRVERCAPRILEGRGLRD